MHITPMDFKSRIIDILFHTTEQVESQAKAPLLALAVSEYMFCAYLPGKVRATIRATPFILHRWRVCTSNCRRVLAESESWASSSGLYFDPTCETDKISVSLLGLSLHSYKTRTPVQASMSPSCPENWLVLCCLPSLMPADSKPSIKRKKDY